MFTMFEHVSVLAFAIYHKTQNTAEADKDAISFEGF